MSYRAAPKAYMEESAIEDMRRTMSVSMFNRELEAIFSDDSGGFFSAKAMEEATIPLGEYPTVKIVGEADKKYVLAIDPNYNNAETSDNFAMAILEINQDDETCLLVHAYAVANSTNEKRCLYLKYLLSKFNIVYIIVDNSGGPGFLQIAKDSKSFPRPLDLFEHDFLNINSQEGIEFTKQNFSPQDGKIIHSQAFGVEQWIRRANENLQWMIEKKKIRFAAPIFHDSDLKIAMDTDIPIEDLHFSISQGIGRESNSLEEKKSVPKTFSEEIKTEFVEHLSDMISQTKKECSLIELTANINGHHQYDLPPSMRKDSSPKKARRDSYTALLLAAWGAKCYFELFREGPKQEFVFSPRMFR
jgi:hypothetical protein